MLQELNEVLDTVESVGWSIGKDVFAEIMHKVEDGTVVWSDSMALLQVRMQATQKAWMSVGKGQQAKGKRHRERRYACWHYNYARCFRGPEHVDERTGTVFRHICELCEKRSDIRWDHAAWQCTESQQYKYQ